jgi:DNA-directed RNA polymerase I subunit RPA1
MSYNPKDNVIRKQVSSVTFGFYSDEDTRRRSVCEITSSVAFDPTNTPLIGGLYDPRLGTTEPTIPCRTCALPHKFCPGHAGHIELVVPVYHPLLLPEILSFLKCKCFNCHKFQAPPRTLAIYRAKFTLLAQHDIKRFLQVDDHLAQLSQQAENKQAAAIAMDAWLRNIAPQQQQSQQKHEFNSFERKLRKDLMNAFQSDCKRMKRCEHCGAYNPKIRHDGSNKIFQSQLSKTQARQNKIEGIVLGSARMKATDGTKMNNATTAKQDNDADSMDDDNEEQEKESDSDDDDDDDEETNHQLQKGDQFMHASEVQAQFQQTWQRDPFLCNTVFGCNNSPLKQQNGYNFYFLQAIPVPPSRFRPAMQVMGASVEHSQTQYLSKMIVANDAIRLHANNQARAYAAWIDLQTHANCFMDSSKHPNPGPDVAMGIKQLLERKEGLFRMNMMGKRVDYACRSVISPDPYIGTNEIGLPKYFATVLTYPTPVTDRNVREMRQLVERGIEYPGARWVEINGQRKDLAKMKKERREGLAAQLLTYMRKSRGMPALVGRQLRDGDYVLMNRQVSFCVTTYSL